MRTIRKLPPIIVMFVLGVSLSGCFVPTIMQERREERARRDAVHKVEIAKLEAERARLEAEKLKLDAERKAEQTRIETEQKAKDAKEAAEREAEDKLIRARYNAEQKRIKDTFQERRWKAGYELWGTPDLALMNMGAPTSRTEGNSVLVWDYRWTYYVSDGTRECACLLRLTFDKESKKLIQFDPNTCRQHKNSFGLPVE